MWLLWPAENQQSTPTRQFGWCLIVNKRHMQSDVGNTISDFDETTGVLSFF